MFNNVILAADAAAANANGSQSMWFTVGYIVVIFLVMYLVFIRPQKKREKQANDMRNALVVGDKVTTIGGIVGEIVNINDDEVTIATSVEKTQLVFVKSAIYEKKVEKAD